MRLDPSLKRRLIIAIIIIALVVIFLPTPFGNIHFRSSQAAKQVIPPAPKQAATPVLSNQQAQSVNQGFVPLGKPAPITKLSSQEVSKSQQQIKAPTANAIKQKEQVTHKPLVYQQAVKLPNNTQTKADVVDQKLTTQAHAAHSSKSVQAPTHKRATKKKPKITIIPGNVTAITTSADSSAPVSFAKAVSVHKKPAQRRVARVAPLSDDSTVVGQLNSTSHKPIYITQSALGTNVLPDLHVRQSDIDSANAAVQRAIKTNIHVAKAMNRAWVVQLGSFADPKRSAEVVTRLRKKGYAAFAYKTTVHGAIKYRVYVGPFLRESQAREKLKHISKEFRLPGYIHHFDATKLK